MPIYEYACDACGRGTEVYCSVSEYTREIACECGQTATRTFTPHHVMPDIQPYRSMIDGSIVSSRSTHKAHLKQHGCVEVGNERMPARKPVPMAPLHEDIKRAIHEVRRGR